jgi:hypothetical protein
MTSDPSPLKSTLDDLHRQLSSLERLEPEERARLSETLAEIQTALANKKSPGSESLMRRLGEMAREFEDSHPTLSTSIGSLINTLGNSGI